MFVSENHQSLRLVDKNQSLLPSEEQMSEMRSPLLHNIRLFRYSACVCVSVAICICIVSLRAPKQMTQVVYKTELLVCVCVYVCVCICTHTVCVGGHYMLV